MNMQIISTPQRKAMGLMSEAVSTMTSLELLEIVNRARQQFDEKPVRRTDFTARCKDELEGDYYETFVVSNPRGPATEVLRLTRDQCMLVAMRESKSVRRSVLDHLKQLDGSHVPQSLPEALRLAADLAEKAEALKIERDEAVRTKAQIGSNREATAMATASAATRKAKRLEAELDQSMQYASVKRMEMLYHGQKFNWRHLKSTGTEMGIQSIDIFDANYGTVKAYHADVWREAYALDINQSEVSL